MKFVYGKLQKKMENLHMKMWEKQPNWESKKFEEKLRIANEKLRILNENLKIFK